MIYASPVTQVDRRNLYPSKILQIGSVFTSCSRIDRLRKENKKEHKQYQLHDSEDDWNKKKE